MQNRLSLYASKKLLPFLGKQFLKEVNEVDPNDLNPLFCWYADVYYYKRSKYLTFCNEISRFSFAAGPFKADAKANFMDFFKLHLQENLKGVLPNPKQYLDQLDGYGKITQTHRGAVAHINRLKVT